MISVLDDFDHLFLRTREDKKKPRDVAGQGWFLTKPLSAMYARAAMKPISPLLVVVEYQPLKAVTHLHAVSAASALGAGRRI
jgi:hypothetical protein